MAWHPKGFPHSTGPSFWVESWTGGRDEGPKQRVELHSICPDTKMVHTGEPNTLMLLLLLLPVGEFTEVGGILK